MWIRKPVNICAQCGFAVTAKNFINKTFFVNEDSRLVLPVEKDKGRLQGCIYCLQLLEAEEAGMIEKTEFPNRTIYTFKPTMKDNFIGRIVNFFKPNPKTKARNHEQSE